MSTINDLDAVVRALGIEDSHMTPAEAVAELQKEITRLRADLAEATRRYNEAVVEGERLRKALVPGAIAADPQVIYGDDGQSIGIRGTTAFDREIAESE